MNYFSRQRDGFNYYIDNDDYTNNVDNNNNNDDCNYNNDNCYSYGIYKVQTWYVDAWPQHFQNAIKCQNGADIGQLMVAMDWARIDPMPTASIRSQYSLMRSISGHFQP